MPSDPVPAAFYQSRIVDLVWVDPKELKPHPNNWRVHTDEQKQAFREAAGKIGIIDPPKRSINSGYLIDGHLRVEIAVEDGIEQIQVIDVDLDWETELKSIASHDTIGGMAEPNAERLQALHEATDWSESPSIKAAFDRLLETAIPIAAVVMEPDEIDASPGRPGTPYFVINLPLTQPERVTFITATDIAKQGLPQSATVIDALMTICAEMLES